MKTIKIIGLTLLAFVFSLQTNAQEGNVEQKSIPKVAKGGPLLKKIEMSDNNKLKSYFVTGEVPVDFPRDQKVLTDEENEKRVLDWLKLPANFDLLSEAGKKNYNPLIKKEDE